MYIVGTNGFMCGLIIFYINNSITCIDQVRGERERERACNANEFCLWFNTGKLIVATQQLIGRGCQFCLHPQTTLSSSPVLIITLKLFP